MLAIDSKKENEFYSSIKRIKVKMGKEEKKEPFLTNLGRATMRGLRKCQKCGTLNGTRGYSCKNKTCDVVFKETETKKKPVSEPCKINAGSNSQIYSVRLRDKGPDYRGFVQFPCNTNLDSGHLIGSTFPSSDMMSEGARCYVESCKKQHNMISSEIREWPCIHIKAALRCSKESQSLTLKSSVLNTLPVPRAFKDEMYQLATIGPGSLVQRVSKNMMVVKCKLDPNHPLGFLHFSFVQPKNKKDSDYKFYCSCHTFKYNQSTKEAYRKCVHFYACIVAFASDRRLSTEFAHYVGLVKNEVKMDSLCLNLVVDKNDVDGEDEMLVTLDGTSHAIATIRDEETEEGTEEEEGRPFFLLNEDTDQDGATCHVQVQVVSGQTRLLDGSSSTRNQSRRKDELMGSSKTDESELQAGEAVHMRNADGSETVHLRNADGGSITMHHLPDLLPISPSADSVKNEEVLQAALASFQTTTKTDSKKNENKSEMGSSNKRAKVGFSGNCSREQEVALPFVSWLACVTERINQTMHYGFSCKPDPLVFHLPKVFFDCLNERILGVTGIKKLKTVMETENFVRKDALPLGKFTKNTLKLATLNQVQGLLWNSEIPLEPVRYFSAQKDGSYKQCHMPITDSSTELEKGLYGISPIKPREYKTVMRVGSTCHPRIGEQPTPFVLEWIPNILPQTQIGELRIKFEFDQYCNGQLVVKQPSILVSKVSLIPSTATTGKSLCPPLAPRPVQKKIVPHSVSSSESHLVTIPLSSDSIVSSSDTITVLTF